MCHYRSTLSSDSWATLVWRFSSRAIPNTSKYFKANMAPARNYHHGVPLVELSHTISRIWFPWASCRFRPGPQCQAHPSPVQWQPISKLESIKVALDTYETTGQICLDPSQTLNKAIRHPKYIILTLEENFHKLHGMKYMTVIVVKEAFQNIPLTLPSSLMTTMYTPWGRTWVLQIAPHEVKRQP